MSTINDITLVNQYGETSVNQVVGTPHFVVQTNRTFTTVDVSDASDFGVVTNVTELNIAAEANSTYKLKYFLCIHSAVQAVVRMCPSYPPNILSVYAGLAGAQSSSSANTVEPPTNQTQQSAYVSTQAGDYTLAEFTMVVKTGISAGDIIFGFESGVQTAFVMAGSFVEWEKIA